MKTLLGAEPVVIYCGAADDAPLRLSQKSINKPTPALGIVAMPLILDIDVELANDIQPFELAEKVV